MVALFDPASVFARGVSQAFTPGSAAADAPGADDDWRLDPGVPEGTPARDDVIRFDAAGDAPGPGRQRDATALLNDAAENDFDEMPDQGVHAHSGAGAQTDLAVAESCID